MCERASDYNPINKQEGKMQIVYVSTTSGDNQHKLGHKTTLE